MKEVSDGRQVNEEVQFWSESARNAASSLALKKLLPDTLKQRFSSHHDVI